MAGKEANRKEKVYLVQLVGKVKFCLWQKQDLTDRLAILPGHKWQARALYLSQPAVSIILSAEKRNGMLML